MRASNDSHSKFLCERGVLQIIMYFVLMGVLLPTFDKIHYFFLLDNCEMKTSEYDLLMLFPFVGVALAATIYVQFMS